MSSAGKKSNKPKVAEAPKVPKAPRAAAPKYSASRNVMFGIAIISMVISVINLFVTSPTGLGHSFQVLLSTFTGTDAPPTAAGTCDASAGPCPDDSQQTAAQVVMPKGANAAGRPRDAPKDCVDRHEECIGFQQAGECLRNPGWMIVNCPASCNAETNACALRDPKLRCGRAGLNISTSPVYRNGRRTPEGAEDGDMHRMFSSLQQRFGDRYPMEVLSRSPWVVVLDNFTTPEEGAALVSSIQRWERSTDTGAMNDYGESGRILSSGRTSSNGWCTGGCEEVPLVKRVFGRIEEVTGVPRRHYESFQVLRYEPGQHYQAHHDYGAEDVALACGPRILTFFLYLSDVEEGGETAFPSLGIAVKPRRGRALLWPSTLDEDLEAIDRRTVHEARPVIKGSKLAANAWIHLYEYAKPNLWGCTGSFDEL